MPVEFVHGSFIPAGAEAYTEHNPESFWLVTDADGAYDDLGLDPDDFDVVVLEFKVCGIEIERDLVDASQRLAEDYGLPVEFVHGSFIPAGAEAYTEHYPESFWLVTDADDAYDDLGLDPDDFDVVFAYAWPDDERLIATLFEEYAAEEALLLMYNQFNSVSLRRKVGKRPGSS